MTLRRLLTTSTISDVTVMGYLVMFKPDAVGTGSVMQGDATVSILNNEILACAWPGPPRQRDQMVIDGRIWSVQGSTPLWEGTTCIGHDIYVRGG
jgi:hypothetical protein